jgi:hypothetical protein
MRNPAEPSQHGPPMERQSTTTIYVPSAPLASYEEGAKARTLLRSVGVLDGWLEQNEVVRSEDEVRVRRMKRLREEALEQLRIELKRTRP